MSSWSLGQCLIWKMGTPGRRQRPSKVRSKDQHAWMRAWTQTEPRHPGFTVDTVLGAFQPRGLSRTSLKQLPRNQGEDQRGARANTGPTEMQVGHLDGFVWQGVDLEGDFSKRKKIKRVWTDCCALCGDQAESKLASCHTRWSVVTSTQSCL